MTFSTPTSGRRQGPGLLPASFLAIAGLLVFHAPALRAAPAPPSTVEIARQVDQHYNRLHSLRVQFTEKYQGMEMERTESGTLLLEKPGRMRWDYDRPAGKLFVIDGKQGYSYTPGDAQAQRYPAAQLEDFRSPLRFLLGHTQLEKELTGISLTAQGANYLLRGTPKAMEQQVSEVQLTVTAAGEILRIQWQGTDGSTTAFDLSGEQENPPIAAGAFLFEPPAGVPVVRGLPPI